MSKLAITLLFILAILINQETGLSENYYKWVDKDGVTHVTDNPKKIPPQYRSNIEIVKEKDTGFKAFRKNLQKQLNKNKTLILYILGGIAGLLVLNKLLKKLRDKSSEYKKGKYDEVIKKSGIDLMTIPQFRAFAKNLLSTKGFRIREMESDLDFGIDFIAEKSNSSYLVKVISDSITTSRTVLNDLMRDTSKYECDKALVITKNYFSEDAIEFSRSSPCELIDRNALGKLIKDSGLY